MHYETDYDVAVMCDQCYFRTNVYYVYDEKDFCSLYCTLNYMRSNGDVQYVILQDHARCANCGRGFEAGDRVARFKDKFVACDDHCLLIYLRCKGYVL